MLSLTKGAAKELVPVAGVPVVVRVLEECAASGIDRVIVVVSPTKQSVIDALSPLAGQPKMPGSIEFIEQTEPRGLADAIRHGRAFAGSEPLLVALPDNLFAGSAPGARQVIDTFHATGKNVVAMVEITAEEARLRGPTAVYPGKVEGDLYHIESIPSKGKSGATFDTAGASSAFTGVGRYVFLSDVFAVIDDIEDQLAPGAELDDVPLMQRLLANGLLSGRRIRGQFFDVGIVSGYHEADAAFAGLNG